MTSIRTTTEPQCSGNRHRLLKGGRLSHQVVCVVATGLCLSSVACTPPPDGQPDRTLTDSLGNPLHAITSKMVMGNLSASRKLNLLARVEAQPDEMIEFYEPKPGAIMLIGGGAPSKPLIFTRQAVRGKDVEALWTMATKGAPAPRLLLDAIARARTQSSKLGSLAATGEAAPAVLATPRPRSTGPARF